MPQYPQGIFQSLDWLMKKVKILALSKQPVYDMGLIATGTTYTMVGRGIYKGEATGTGKVQFPNPALCKGQTITLVVTNGVMNFSSTYAPLKGVTPMTGTTSSGNSIYVSDGTNWYGGELV